jgi:hypothetical protein
MMRIKHNFVYLTIGILIAFTVMKGHAQSNSVLGNIDCGGGNVTCLQQKTGTTGAVRCTCTATCLSDLCITPSVGSTRAFQWGMPPLRPCIFSVTGTATGGPTVTSNPSTQTAVFTNTTVTGLVLGNTSSKQIVDCFQGTLEDDPLIGAICA